MPEFELKIPAFFPCSPLVAGLFISVLYRLIFPSEVEKRTEIIPNSQLGQKRWKESVNATIENGRLTALTATMHGLWENRIDFPILKP